MDELENLLNSANINEEYHDKIFGGSDFEKLYTEINIRKFEDLRNKIYWLSLLIFRISFINYLENINKDIDIAKSNLKLRKNNIIIFHPLINITSEICKYLKNDYIYPSIISMLCRQIIEQICIIKEIEKEKIDDIKIIEACIESYNLQLRANSLEIDELNNENKGLLKVLSYKTTYGKLANKYNYGYMYNFFSGDIHALSQIDKLTPFQKDDYEYYNIYFKCVFSLLKDLIIVLKKYDKVTNIDINKLKEIEFIYIKNRRD